LFGVVAYFVVFLCDLATLRETLLYEKAISRKDRKEKVRHCLSGGRLSLKEDFGEALSC
jgi:hypothetical protein